MYTITIPALQQCTPLLVAALLLTSCTLFFDTEVSSPACQPDCSSGYVCIGGECVTSCNPACGENQTCGPDRTCVTVDAGVEEPDVGGDDTGGTGSDSGTGDCNNSADLLLLSNTSSVLSAANVCAMGCLYQPQSHQCTQDCIVEDSGLSQGCSACFADAAACTVAYCALECSANPSSTDCLDCQSEECIPDFDECTGI